MSFLSLKQNIKTVLTISDDQVKYFDAVLGDKNRFEQILLNFISNSIKFTQRNGTIEVKLQS